MFLRLATTFFFYSLSFLISFFIFLSLSLLLIFVENISSKRVFWNIGMLPILVVEDMKKSEARGQQVSSQTFERSGVASTFPRTHLAWQRSSLFGGMVLKEGSIFNMFRNLQMYLLRLFHLLFINHCIRYELRLIYLLILEVAIHRFLLFILRYFRLSSIHIYLWGFENLFFFLSLRSHA